MPRREKSMSSTCRCTRDGNFTRSFGHHAPEAPKPSIGCASAGSTRATGRFCCAAVAVTVAGAVLAMCIDEHDATSTTTAPIRPARRTALRLRRRLVGCDAPLVPWPHAVDLDLEREAQNHSNQHDGAQDRDVLHGRVDHDRTDDVRDDEHFETEQDHPPEVLAQVPVSVPTAPKGDLTRETSERAEPPDDEDRRPDALDDVDDMGKEIAIRHRATLLSTRKCALEMGESFSEAHAGAMHVISGTSALRRGGRPPRDGRPGL